MFRMWLILLFTLSFAACITTQSTVEASTDMEETHLDHSKPMILFVTYKFNGDKLEITNRIVTNGALKARSNSEPSPNNGDLIFQQVDADQKILYSEVVKDPRTRIVEYTDSAGVFQKKTVNIENPEFTIRSQLDPKVRYVEVKAFNEDERKIRTLNKKEI